MLALEEFSNFVTCNQSALAETYTQLLAEQGYGYEKLPYESRVASARRLLTAVVAACESETTGPLCRLFAGHTNEPDLRWDPAVQPPDPLLEVECLGQTLTPVVSNLEAGKFLWHLLAEARKQLYRGPTEAIDRVHRHDVEQEELIQRKHIVASLKKRAHELETVTQMSTAISTILETDELLQTVVDLAKKRFGLYHAHIYLLDDAHGRLNLAAGADEVGRKMVDDGWSISLDEQSSLVAQAARSHHVVVVDDVRNNKGFLPNPRLPKTRSEMAVPIISGDNEVLGVLDVQSDVLNYFTEEDVRVQSALAAQVAAALRNARLYEASQRLARREQTIREIADTLRAATDLEMLLETAARELGQRLGVRHTVLELGLEPGSDIGNGRRQADQVVAAKDGHLRDV